MKLLESLIDLLNEKDDEDKDIADAPAPSGAYMTTAQAARELGTGMSRIRQLVADGQLTSKQPEKGRRDHQVLKKDVDALKKQERSPGRPEKEDKDD